MVPVPYTGEDCGELHIHGSAATIRAVLRHLSGFFGVRHAEAGEFTRRAFDNGRLDLTEVEGLGDLIAAQTEAQRRQALALASGGLSAIYAQWADRILHARAMIEAEFDFSDEEDVPGSVSERIWSDVTSLALEINAHIDSIHLGERLKDGFRIALIGSPNVGKSSLLNALAQREAAIVTDIAGTTRDVIEVHLDLGGYPVTVLDTAGLRQSEDLVESEGIRRALAAANDADLVLHLVNGDSSVESALYSEALKNLGHVWQVSTKADISGDPAAVSTVTGHGLPELVQRVVDAIRSRFSQAGAVLPNRERYRQHLSLCLECLRESQDETLPLELRAEALRGAADHLGRITGRVDPDHILDVIFRDFCIGK
jgi:tRNA modification GTPase